MRVEGVWVCGARLHGVGAEENSGRHVVVYITCEIPFRSSDCDSEAAALFVCVIASYRRTKCNSLSITVRVLRGKCCKIQPSGLLLRCACSNSQRVPFVFHLQ